MVYTELLGSFLVTKLYYIGSARFHVTCAITVLPEDLIGDTVPR
jgi:hypothetical protein